MGRAFAEVCKFVGCLPSELYVKHNPTVADFHFVNILRAIELEEEAERFGGTESAPSSGGGGVIRPHIPYHAGRR